MSLRHLLTSNNYSLDTTGLIIDDIKINHNNITGVQNITCSNMTIAGLDIISNINNLYTITNEHKTETNLVNDKILMLENKIYVLENIINELLN